MSGGLRPVIDEDLLSARPWQLPGFFSAKTKENELNPIAIFAILSHSKAGSVRCRNCLNSAEHTVPEMGFGYSWGDNHIVYGPSDLTVGDVTFWLLRKEIRNGESVFRLDVTIDSVTEIAPYLVAFTGQYQAYRFKNTVKGTYSVALKTGYLERHHIDA